MYANDRSYNLLIVDTPNRIREYESIYNPTFEVWKTINNLKTHFKNKEDEIALSMVANLQIHCKEQKKNLQSFLIVHKH